MVLVPHHDHPRAHLQLRNPSKEQKHKRILVVVMPIQTDPWKDPTWKDVLTDWRVWLALLKSIPSILSIIVTLPISVPCMRISLAYGIDRFPLITKIGYGLSGGLPFRDHWGVLQGGPVEVGGRLYPKGDEPKGDAKARE